MSPLFALPSKSETQAHAVRCLHSWSRSFTIKAGYFFIGHGAVMHHIRSLAELHVEMVFPARRVFTLAIFSASPMQALFRSARASAMRSLPWSATWGATASRFPLHRSLLTGRSPKSLVGAFQRRAPLLPVLVIAKLFELRCEQSLSTHPRNVMVLAFNALALGSVLDLLRGAHLN